MMKLNRVVPAALLLALLGAPCHAAMPVDEVARPASEGTLMQGVLADNSGVTLLIGGKRYSISSATTVYDRSGARVSASKLAVGKTLAFSVIQEGSQARIKELWIVK